MAVGSEGDMPLYMHSLIKILREMALSSQGQEAFNYKLFRAKLDSETFSCGQNGPLQLRLDLLESFMKQVQVEVPLHRPAQPPAKGNKKPPRPQTTIDENIKDHLVGKPGTLTIVDLSDPVIDSDSACVLFDICLELFIERTQCGKVIALDEAHNVSPITLSTLVSRLYINEPLILTHRSSQYMHADNASSEAFTSTILKSVREQRHKAVRVVVATQEPTVSPALLDLCSMTFVHRFTSPQWFSTLKKHLAGALFANTSSRSSYHRNDLDGDDAESDDEDITAGLSGEMGLFRKIVKLSVGESLLFCPTAALWVNEKGPVERMWEGSVKFRTRPRVTVDGGKSVMAREAAVESAEAGAG
jgi:hypothetical protein